MIEVQKIIQHKVNGSGYSSLTVEKSKSRHEAQWQPTSDFIDPDGTITEAFHTHIVRNGCIDWNVNHGRGYRATVQPLNCTK